MSSTGDKLCALSSSKKVYCWGAKYLGNGSSKGSLTPVEVAGSSDIAFSKPGIAVLSNGHIFRWDSWIDFTTLTPKEYNESNVIETNAAAMNILDSSNEAILLKNSTVKFRKWSARYYDKDGNSNSSQPPDLSMYQIKQVQPLYFGGYCTLTTEGQIFCWNNCGTPVDIINIDSVKRIIPQNMNF